MKSLKEVKYFVDRKTGCHIPRRQPGVCHEAKSGDNGYIMLALNGKRVRGHRASYTHYKGVIPKGMIVMHTCDNRECINPNHLLLGTKSDNTQDMIKKGRQVTCLGKSKRKLTDKEIEVIKTSELSSYQLAKIYPVSSTHIRRIKNGTRHNANHKQKQYKNENPSSTHTIERSYIAVEIDY